VKVKKMKRAGEEDSNKEFVVAARHNFGSVLVRAWREYVLSVLELAALVGISWLIWKMNWS
jgi:hypothetical protein